MRCLLTVIAVAAFAQVGHSQVVRFDQASRTGGRTEISFSAEWPSSLASAADSARRSSRNTLDVASGGVLFEERTIVLNSLSTPSVVRVAVDYEEIPADDRVYKTHAQRVGRARAEVVAVGLHRKVPTGSLRIPLFELGEDGRLRRIRSATYSIVESGPAHQAKSSALTNPHLAVERSALADGTIFKVAVESDGVYRIDRQFLTELGLNPDQIDPAAVRVLGNGGAPVAAVNGDPRYADLVENAVVVVGGGDGVFSGADAVFFYGEDARGWRYDDGQAGWTHYTHPFSQSNYYFVKVGGGNSRQRETTPFPDGTPSVISQVTGRALSERDDFMWSKEHGSGHTWVSNPIRNGGRIDLLQNVLPPGLTAGEVVYEPRVAIGSNPRAQVRFTSGGRDIGSILAPSTVFPGAEQPAAIASTTQMTDAYAGTGGLQLTMRMDGQQNDPQAAVDWLRVFYRQSLTAANGYLRFATAPTSETVEFELSGFTAQPRVWDVTRPDAIRALEVRVQGNTYRVRLPGGSPATEIVAFTPAAALRPNAESATAVEIQNLHGISSFPDLVIVAPLEFLELANELADMRRSEGLVVNVVRIDQVYNEFSGGLLDMRAIRDYLKFIYDRGEGDNMLKYALFMGDGHFDFRGLSAKEGELFSWIPPYETEESFHPDRSFTSDDYFGLLDDNEGDWVYSGFGVRTFERMDIGVGRFPIQNVGEGRVILDKIRRYESPETYGPWRSRYTVVADDPYNGLRGEREDDDLHMQNIESVVSLIQDDVAPTINLKKIYSESFARVFVNEFRIPDAKSELLSAIERGNLVFNYSGHGGPDGLAQEELFTKQDAEALTNADRLAIFVTATCSFGWWDIDDLQSGAEALLMNPGGGAVAMLTTVRLVYTSRDTSSLNPGLNRALNRALFRRDADGLPTRLGDALLETKNTAVGLIGNSRKFNLLGDPSMRFGLPVATTTVDELNGVALGTSPGQMKAADRVRIAGAVRRPDGSVDESFGGRVEITVWDAVRRVPIKFPRFMPTNYYEVREDLVWRGEVTAVAGEFSAEFVVPIDISYSGQTGRIAAYARNSTLQGVGYSENFVVGGTADTPPDDGEGPEISLFLNDTTFASGGLTTQDPDLIVKLFDHSGINTVGAGVGHEMLLVINDDDARATDVSGAFESDPNSFQKGTVRWKLESLPPGPGSISLRAWDVLNNSTTATLEFVATEQEALALRNVYNYPNPTSGRTRFVFEHNQPSGTPASIRIRVYTLDGRPIRSIDSDEALPGGMLTAGPVIVPWDGRDEDQDPLATGIYLYKVHVSVEGEDGHRDVSERIEKLAVIR